MFFKGNENDNTDDDEDSKLKYVTPVNWFKRKYSKNIIRKNPIGVFFI